MLHLHVVFQILPPCMCTVYIVAIQLLTINEYTFNYFTGHNKKEARENDIGQKHSG